MARTIQAKVSGNTSRLLSRLKRIIQKYIDKLVELEKEFLRLAKWRVMKRIKNKRQRLNLTRDFKRQMLELGVLV